MNLNWTNFKAKYLFTVNFCIMLSVILYTVRKDFHSHWVIGVWLVICLFSEKARSAQVKILKFVGFINSTILLSAFYFLFFTPFSVLYRMFFRNKAFVKADSRFAKKESISSFDLPF